jgi:voltage-gated potassium channel
MRSADPARREIGIALGLLLVLLGIGTVGYRLIEGWTWLDGFYMTFITFTTIGFAEVRHLSTAGRFFTIAISVFGIGLVAFIAARAAQLIITGLPLRERHNRKHIARMTDHYILCGYGRLGQRLADDLAQAGRAFVVIDRDASAIEPLMQAGLPHVVGEAEEEHVLRQAGLERARGVILALPEDALNVFVTLVVREMRPNAFVLARVNQSKNRRKLAHAGADQIIAPDEVGAERMVRAILRPNVDRFFEAVTQGGGGGLELDEVEVGPGAPLEGRTLAQSGVRRAYDTIVVAVVRALETHYNPPADFRLQARDVLIVLGSADQVARLRREGCTAR